MQVEFYCKGAVLINPGVRMPAEAAAAHGITTCMVEGQPTFGCLAKDIYAFLHGSDLAGFNIRRLQVPVLT